MLATLGTSTSVAPVDSTSDGFSLSPYRAVVRKKLITSFERLSEGDPSVALSLMADDVHYRFEGDHALGGERVTKRGVERWFGRLLRLFRGRFVLRSVEVVGFPWATTVYTAFDDFVTAASGASYENHGVQIANLRWGKAVRIRTYVDTARLIRSLNDMSSLGIDEASAPPILE